MWNYYCCYIGSCIIVFFFTRGQSLPAILSSSCNESGRIINFPCWPREVLLLCSKWIVTLFLVSLADSLSLGQLEFLELQFVFIFSNGNLIDLIPSCLLFLVEPFLSRSRIFGSAICILNSSNFSFSQLIFWAQMLLFFGRFTWAFCVIPKEFGIGYASLSSRISTMSRFPLFAGAWISLLPCSGIMLCLLTKWSSLVPLCKLVSEFPIYMHSPSCINECSSELFVHSWEGPPLVLPPWSTSCGNRPESVHGYSKPKPSRPFNLCQYKITCGLGTYYCCGGMYNKQKLYYIFPVFWV